MDHSLLFIKIIIKKLINILSLYFVTYGLISIYCIGYASEYQFKNENVEISFVKGWDTKHGTLFALFIKMDKNWKTYWRYPGESGIAPDLKLLNSKNFKKFDISWPTPKVFNDYGTVIYGYKKNLILPIFFLKKKNTVEMDFEFEIMMGFCDKICIPVRFIINNKNALNSSKTQKKLILKSLENVPQKISNEIVIASCTVSKVKNKLKLFIQFYNNLFFERNNVKELILEYIDPNIWFSKIGKTNNDKNYFANINSINDTNIILDMSKIQFTIISKKGGFLKNGCKSY